MNNNKLWNPVCALVFVGLMVFSVTLAKEPYSLGILGTFGPVADKDNVSVVRDFGTDGFVI